MTDCKAISGAYTLTKLGTAELDRQRRQHLHRRHDGLAGTLTATVSGAVEGNLVVGGGASAATFTTGGTSNAIADAASITVNTNGTVSFGANGETFNNLTVTGGTFNNDCTATSTAASR